MRDKGVSCQRHVICNRVLICALSGVSALFSGIGTARAQESGLHWERQRAPERPRAGAIEGGPGDAPEHDSPLFVCRAEYAGSLQPGKWVKGNCSISYGGKEIVAEDYEIAYGQAGWRPYDGHSAGLIQTGRDTDGSPLYSCRVQYRDLGYQPGKLKGDTCNFPYGGKDIAKRGSFEALYAGTGTGETAKSKGKGVWGKLMDNAKYQQSRRNGAAGSYSGPAADSSVKKDKEVCKFGDDGVHLQPDGSWAGPNCVTADSSGHPVNPEDTKQKSLSEQEKRARYLETHSCLTTDGAEKANQLAEKCNKVTNAPHASCNVQENSCDEIRNATKHGCWGLAASAPDFCFAEYR